MDSDLFPDIEQPEPDSTTPDGEEVEQTAEEGSETEESTESTVDTVMIDGEEVSLDTLKEWKQGKMRRDAFTQKTQELADVKRAEEAKAARLQEELDATKAENAKYKRLDQFILQNPQTTEQYKQMLRQSGASVELDPAMQQLSEQVVNLQKQLEDQSRVVAEAKLEGEWADVRKLTGTLSNSEEDGFADFVYQKQEEMGKPVNMVDALWMYPPLRAKAIARAKDMESADDQLRAKGAAKTKITKAGQPSVSSKRNVLKQDGALAELKEIMGTNE